MDISNCKINKLSKSVDIKKALVGNSLVINTGWTDAARKAAQLSRQAHKSSMETEPFHNHNMGLTYSQFAVDSVGSTERKISSLRDRNHEIAELHKKAAHEHLKSAKLTEDQSLKGLHTEAAKLHTEAEKAHLEADKQKPAVSKYAQEESRNARGIEEHKLAAIAHRVAADYHEEHGNQEEHKYHTGTAKYHEYRADQI